MLKCLPAKQPKDPTTRDADARRECVLAKMSCDGCAADECLAMSGGWERGRRGAGGLWQGWRVR